MDQLPNRVRSNIHVMTASHKRERG